MLIAGAGGHAIEVYGVVHQNNPGLRVHFFDDVTPNLPEFLTDGTKILRNIEDVKTAFAEDPEYLIGVGAPRGRKILDDKLKAAGGKLVSIVSPTALIGSYDVELGEGLNIMTGVVITERVKIGRATLVHIHSSIHHDSQVGEYCELSPGCRILGRVIIGSLVSIGANACVLPGIRIGDNAVIGAGAVVTKDVPPNTTVIGVPARPYTSTNNT